MSDYILLREELNLVKKERERLADELRLLRDEYMTLEQDRDDLRDSIVKFQDMFRAAESLEDLMISYHMMNGKEVENDKRT